MHTVTIKISSEFPIEDISPAALADLFYGIDDGQDAGSVEVVVCTDKPTEPDMTGRPYQMETTPEQVAPIKAHLQSLLAGEALGATPVVRHEMQMAIDRIKPVMLYQEVALVRVELQESRTLAAAYGWGALACELASLEEAALAVQYTLEIRTILWDLTPNKFYRVGLITAYDRLVPGISAKEVGAILDIVDDVWATAANYHDTESAEKLKQAVCKLRAVLDTCEASDDETT